MGDYYYYYYITNQRSNKFQKTTVHAATAAIRVFGQKVPQDLKTGVLHSYLSFRDNDAQTKPILTQNAFDKSSPGGLSTYPERRRKIANPSPVKLEFEAQQKPVRTEVLNVLTKRKDRLNANAASYRTESVVQVCWFFYLVRLLIAKIASEYYLIDFGEIVILFGKREFEKFDRKSVQERETEDTLC